MLSNRIVVSTELEFSLSRLILKSELEQLINNKQIENIHTVLFILSTKIVEWDTYINCENTHLLTYQ